jgi:hypothetical protein
VRPAGGEATDLATDNITVVRPPITLWGYTVAELPPPDSSWAGTSGPIASISGHSYKRAL